MNRQVLDRLTEIGTQAIRDLYPELSGHKFRMVSYDATTEDVICFTLKVNSKLSTLAFELIAMSNDIYYLKEY